jgi:hypothetical protein
MSNRRVAWELDDDTYEIVAKAAATEGITVEHFVEWAVLRKIIDLQQQQIDTLKNNIHAKDATLGMVRDLLVNHLDEVSKETETSTSGCTDASPCEECIPCQAGPKYV